MADQRYEIRPLGEWLGPTTADRTTSARFRAKWTDTLAMLGRETGLLGARLVVLQVDVREGDIRRDGMLRANAKVDFPGVRVSFDSRHGPLTYATDAYEENWAGDPPGWQANIRAIALALEALRAVDRYGVTKTGEQYRGWRAIAAGPSDQTSLKEAAELLAAAGDATPEEVLTDPHARERAYRRAVRVYHPDASTGDRPLFDEINTARALLEGAADLTGASRG